MGDYVKLHICTITRDKELEVMVMDMRKKNTSKLEKWRNKYSAIIISLSCFFSVVVTWGNNWFLTAILILGVFVCGTIGIFDLKRSRRENK